MTGSIQYPDCIYCGTETTWLTVENGYAVYWCPSCSAKIEVKL